MSSVGPHAHTQVEGLSYPGLRWLALYNAEIAPVSIQQVLGRSNSLRELDLSIHTLTRAQVDAFTNVFAEGTLCLTHFTLRSKVVDAPGEDLLNAAAQWVAAPSRSLVRLQFYAQPTRATNAPGCLEAFKQLVLALAQRATDGWPVQHISLWKQPHSVAAKMRRLATRYNVKDVVPVHGSAQA